MVFTPPAWAPKLSQVPDNIPISEFMLNESYGRYPLNQARDPFTCGFTGKSYSASQVVDRVEHLTRGLAKELGWKPNEGSEWDKVLGIFCYNTVCFCNNPGKRTELIVFCDRSTPCLCPGLSTSWAVW